MNGTYRRSGFFALATPPRTGSVLWRAPHRAAESPIHMLPKAASAQQGTAFKVRCGAEEPRSSPIRSEICVCDTCRRSLAPSSGLAISTAATDQPGRRSHDRVIQFCFCDEVPVTKQKMETTDMYLFNHRLAALSAVAAIAAGGAALASPVTESGASRAPDTVTTIPALTGVGTTLTLNAATAAALSGLGVKVAPEGTATASGGAVTFPITSGYVEIHSDVHHHPGYIEGSIEHYGSGLTLSAGSTTVTLSDFVVDPGNSLLYANVNGTPDASPVLQLDGRKVSVSKNGSGDVVLNGTVANLTGAAASALDSAFDTHAIKGGTPLGTVHLVAKGAANTYKGKVAEISRVSGSTSLDLNPTTAAALKSLGITPGVTGKATASGSTVTFPITGGDGVIHADRHYAPGYVDGVILHQDSGLTLTKGGTQVTLSDFTIDPGHSILYGDVDGTDPAANVPLLQLDGRPLKITSRDGIVHLDGTVANLTPTAATALNKAFGVTAFMAGMPLGTAHIAAAGS